MPSQEQATSSSTMGLYETALRLAERYGFGTVLSMAILWFVRTDLVLPIVASHQAFLTEMASTQREITQAVREQTELLYALQPRHRSESGQPAPDN